MFGGSSLYNADEDTPYTTRPSDYYTATKIEAEKLALAANSPTLAVCALRPSGIFGEGDRVSYQHVCNVWNLGSTVVLTQH